MPEADDVEAAIIHTRFSGKLLHFASVGSTNQLAVEAANSGSNGGVWVADEQTAGRGRGGHVWHSPAFVEGDAAGLYVSILVTPQLLKLSDDGLPMSIARTLPLATGLAVQAAVSEVTGLALDLRWPNDLMFGDLKCGGILVESASESATESASLPRLRYAVIGIGLNLNQAGFPAELQTVATSLRLQGGVRVERALLLAAVLRQLDAELTRLLSDAPDRYAEALLERFTKASSWVTGKRVRVGADDLETGGYTGWTCGLDAEGFLTVEADDGTLRTVLSGGVRAIQNSSQG